MYSRPLRGNRSISSAEITPLFEREGGTIMSVRKAEKLLSRNGAVQNTRCNVHNNSLPPISTLKVTHYRSHFVTVGTALVFCQCHILPE